MNISSEKLNEVVNILKVIAHPIRLNIIDFLSEKEKLTLTEIQTVLNIQQAVASHHITLLEDKGVLISEKVGRQKFISLRFPELKKIIECMEECSK